MKLFRRYQSKRKQPTISKTVFATESLEERRLMAADAFNFEVLNDPTSVAITTQMHQTVDELANVVEQQVPQDQIQQAIELGEPEILFAELGPNFFQPVIEAADIPGLGQVIQEDEAISNSVTDLVILELMDVPDESPEYTDSMNFLLNELNCQIDLFGHLDGTTRDELPPQFEQLRMDLGDEGFAEWLHQNQQETGTLSGVSEEEIERLGDEALQQLDQQEAALDQWLLAFNDSHMELELPEAFETFRVEVGDQWLAVWLQSNSDLFGNFSGLPEQQLVELELVDPGLQGFELQEQSLDNWLRTEGQPLLLPPDGQAIDVGVPEGFDDRLPPAMEQLRLTMGNEAFATWLETNVEQFGNALGIQEGDWFNEELKTQEQTLQSWLERFRFESTVPTVFELAGDTDGDGVVAFGDFLTLSSNFGTSVDVGYLAGDFDLDGVVAFSDFLTLSSNFGTTSIDCSCDTSDANNPEGAEEIQDAGELEIRDGSVVFVSDKTVPGDAKNLKEDAPAGTPIHENVSSWQDVIDKIKNMPDGSITGDLVISGHGAEGGVQGSNGDIDGEDITEEQAAILKKKLGPNARIVVLGCCQANKELDEHMQRLANLTGASVVGNQGSVNNGANGKDDWFEFKPAKK